MHRGSFVLPHAMKQDINTAVLTAPAAVEIALKIVLVGAPKAGKTSLVRRLCDKAFREEYVPTLGFDIVVVPYGTYQGRPVKLHLWDVAGSQLTAQPCHHALIGDGAAGVMYVMDVTNRDSLQAVDDWDRALSQYLPPTVCKLLVGHKADLPVYVVNDEALSLFVASASGFRGWCLTVGSSEYGDYDVAARRGGGSATADVRGRYKGQSLSGEKQLSVSEAVRTLVGHVFRAGGADTTGGRRAAVLGLGACAGGATPLYHEEAEAAADTLELLGFGGDDSRDQGSKPLSERRAKTTEMWALLQNGRGPDSTWVEKMTAECREVHEINDRSDRGWRYFAGRVEREEAEALLRGRAEGTFFIRRKGPALLLLSYVAKSTATPSTGRKSTGGQSPKGNAAASSHLRLGGRGPSPGALTSGHSEDEKSTRTSVQHALLVYKGGYFSDEKGRLGQFPSMDELLKSKISTLARHPLIFRREKGRYVLVDQDEGTDGASNSAATARSSAPSHSTRPSTSNPFASDDSAKHDARGSMGDAFAPVVSGDLFCNRPRYHSETPGDLRTRHLTQASTSRLASSVPLRENASPQGLTRGCGLGADPCRKDKGPSTVGVWNDRRASGRTSPTSGAGSTTSAGGSLWMEAAAAAAAGSSEGTRRSPRRNSTGSERGADATGVGDGRRLLSPESGTGGRTVATPSGRRSRKGSASSGEDGGSVSTSSVADSAVDTHSVRGRHKQPSAMAIAAEAAAAIIAAKGHPDAKHIEERSLAVEVAISEAFASMEERLSPLVVPKCSSGVKTTRFSPRSTYSSPRGSTSYPAQKREQSRHWVGAVPLDASVAPLVAATALLMERSFLRQQDLRRFVESLHERAVSLALADATIATTPMNSSPLSSPGALVHQDSRDLALRVPDELRPQVGRADSPSHDSSVEEPASGTKGTHEGQNGYVDDLSSALSTCDDFERILGPACGNEGEGEAIIPGVPRHATGGQRSATVRADTGRGRAASSSSMAAEHSSSTFEIAAMHDGHSIGVGTRDRRRSGSPFRGRIGDASDSWVRILHDMDAAGNQCRELMTDWEAVSKAFSDAYDQESHLSEAGSLAEYHPCR